jgi:GNAT superfamily N-acetyltransferase
MRAVLQEERALDAPGLRCPTVVDVEALGSLMHRAYAGTIDDGGESLDDAVAEVRKTFGGDYGAFDGEHSSVAVREGRVVSATLVTRWQARPFVAFTFTHPSFARQGLARATLERSMALLRRDGETELRLVVTLANDPARRLYESLAFTREQ